MKKRNRRDFTIRILALSILGASWLIFGPDLLASMGVTGKAIDLLTLPIVMVVFFWAAAQNKSFYACEVRTFRRLIGK